MAYLTNEDYYFKIQQSNLNQITNNTSSVVDQASLLSEATLRSYLIQTYDIDTEFGLTASARATELVNYGVDIALYHIHTRIAPNNIPELRVNNYNTAITWLKMVATGQLNVAIAKIDPSQGERIRFGGVKKQPNQY